MLMVSRSIYSEPTDTKYQILNMINGMIQCSAFWWQAGENLRNAGSIFTPLGKSEAFEKPNCPIPCNCIMGPIEEKVLPSLVEFPAQSMAVSHSIRVDEYLEDHFCQAPTCVQHTSTHDPAITSFGGPLNWPRLVLMAKDQPQ